MVTDKINIENYKSIKKLDLKTKRVNLFIGEPNSGKSNILEALSFFSINAFNNLDFKSRFRIQKASDLFYDLDVNNPIKINTNQLEVEISFSKNADGTLNNNFDIIFLAKSQAMSKPRNLKTSIPNAPLGTAKYKLDYGGRIGGPSHDSVLHGSDFRTYEYKFLEKFSPDVRPFLACPNGNNIPSLLLSNSKLRNLVKMVLSEKGYKLLIEPEENDLKMVKEHKDEGIFISYPYVAVWYC